jgi:hypothetical protein
MWTAIIKPILAKRFASSAKIPAATFKAVPSRDAALRVGVL